MFKHMWFKGNIMWISTPKISVSKPTNPVYSCSCLPITDLRMRCEGNTYAVYLVFLCAMILTPCGHAQLSPLDHYLIRYLHLFSSPAQWFGVIGNLFCVLKDCAIPLVLAVLSPTHMFATVTDTTNTSSWLHHFAQGVLWALVSIII